MERCKDCGTTSGHFPPCPVRQTSQSLRSGDYTTMTAASGDYTTTMAASGDYLTGEDFGHTKVTLTSEDKPKQENAPMTKTYTLVLTESYPDNIPHPSQIDSQHTFRYTIIKPDGYSISSMGFASTMGAAIERFKEVVNSKGEGI